MKRALIYLRVSTKEQAEGFSLDAQREACVRFVADKGWLVAGEYSDRGESARTANRPMFREMLERVAADPSIAYVVVHKLDRLARNVEDHVVVRAHLRKHGVTLVSFSEGVDDSPSGQLVENIMASIAAFYSANLGQETMKGMQQKARSGGWPHKAPIGYRNIRQDGLRRSVAHIVHDPVQAPLVREAFQVFSTGELSIRQVRDLMADQGLRTAAGSIPAVSQMHRLLTNELYAGVVSWQDVEHHGNHEPIVDPELFEAVQAVIRKHQGGAVRQRRHHHYLRGKLFCATCASRWTDMQVKRQRYRYFFCLGRHLRRTACEQPYMPADELERLVESHYFRVFIPDERKAEIRRFVAEEVNRRFASLGPSKDAAKKRIAELAAERQRLLRLYLAGGLEMDALQREQDRIGAETQALSARAEPEADLDLAPKVVERAFAIIDNIADAYLRANERERSMWNEAVFARIWVGDREVKRTDFRDMFASILSDTSSNWASLVAPAGFEPAISALRGLRPSPLDDGASNGWWAALGLNQRPLACEASALPLS